jgi:hypothetical protein
MWNKFAIFNTAWSYLSRYTPNMWQYIYIYIYMKHCDFFLPFHTEESVEKQKIIIVLCKMWGFHGGDYEECRLLTLDPRSRIIRPWRLRRYVPPKRRFAQDINGATSLKTAFFLIIVLLAMCMAFTAAERCASIDAEFSDIIWIFILNLFVMPRVY